MRAGSADIGSAHASAAIGNVPEVAGAIVSSAAP